MKNLLKISIIFFLIYSTQGSAQTFNQIEANTDENCNNMIAGFKIPKGLIAFNFDFKVIPQWEACNDRISSDYNMIGIRGKNKSNYLYQYYIYRNGEVRESSSLLDFVLGPGEFELVVSSHKGNSVILKYSTGSEISSLIR